MQKYFALSASSVCPPSRIDELFTELDRSFAYLESRLRGLRDELGPLHRRSPLLAHLRAAELATECLKSDLGELARGFLFAREDVA